MIELLIVLAVMAVLIWIGMSVMTGSGGKGGVKQQAEHKIQQISTMEIYRAGFYPYALDHNDQFPSTKTDRSMESDTTHEVFRILVDEGLPASMLISPNEYDTAITPGSGSSFGQYNTSFALPDYDADNWLRYDLWQLGAGSNVVLMSDRWIDDPNAPSFVQNLQAGSTEANPGFWNLMFNDGHQETVTQPALSNGDALFEDDPSFGKNDTLMVHD